MKKSAQCVRMFMKGDVNSKSWRCREQLPKFYSKLITKNTF